MKPFWKREPTKTDEKATEHNMIKMITMTGDYYYAWDGKLYESDIVRACIRPKVKAIGKLVGKHIRDDPKGGIKVNTEANIRFLLSEPNPYMTAQQMQEKVATQLCLQLRRRCAEMDQYDVWSNRIIGGRKMFEEMNMIVLSGKEYPMKCDNLVLEKIQDKYEDLGKYENMLNGFVPELDEYGEEVRNEDGLLVGHYKMPDIKIINEAAVWFIQEGLAIKREENKEEIPEISDRTLIRQIDFNPRELSTILHQEFSRCFERKNATTTQGKAENQNR